MKIKLFLIIIFLLFLSGAIFVYWMIYVPITPGSEVMSEFNIKEGEGTKEIALNLEKAGLIRWGPLFRLYTLLEGISGNLQAGNYLFSRAMNIPEIAEKLVSGKVLKKEITIIEGWNVRDIGWYFENQGISQAEEFFELVGFPATDYRKPTDFPNPKDFSGDFDFLKDKVRNIGLEGYLFPDTYQIKKGENLEAIIKKILKNFNTKLTPVLREEIKKEKKTIFEIVTMASLLEKEVRTLEDKKLVSGILWKRLKAGMPLQVDATITYLTQKKTTKISIEETKIDSPYNTYKYPGLPLGPISNPGLESIIAAIYPQESNYWYYLSIPDGTTIFSKNLKEHNIAKAKYLK